MNEADSFVQYRVTHITTYDYTEPVSLCQNVAHLAPRAVAGQTCLETSLAIAPWPTVLVEQIDYFGNPATFFAVQEPHRQLTLTALHHVEVGPRAAPDSSKTPAWETVRDRLRADRSPEVLAAAEFVFDSRYVNVATEFLDYARASFGDGRPLLEAALDLTSRIHANFEYDPRSTTVATALAEVFANRHGVCQDFAHLQIACLRSLGLSARYVSGYLSTEPPPGCVPLVGSDATHAWLSIFCPGAGWIDLDPTNDQITGEGHILLAWGRDYDDVSPVKGVVLGGGQHAVNVAVNVERLSEQEPLGIA
ncbi:MAG TPA: transglutaminase family protein [Planctomycetaceae bacterium]|jgi:transglutaminase-like putative cysteine protease